MAAMITAQMRSRRKTSRLAAVAPWTARNAAVHGVSCDVCHKIAHVDEEKINYPGLFPGAVDFTRPSGPEYLQVQYGLLGDADFSVPEAMRASYQPQLSAAVCGTRDW